MTGTDLDAEQARGDAADAKLKQLNEAALARGRYTQSVVDQAERNRMTGLTGNVNAQVQGAFFEGLGEGFGNLFKPFQIVPPWVWVVGVGLVLWKLGAFKKIKL